MLDCVCKALLREKVATHLQNGEKLNRSGNQVLLWKGIPPKEIPEEFMETLGKESPSYSTVRKWAAKFKRGREREQ